MDSTCIAVGNVDVTGPEGHSNVDHNQENITSEVPEEVEKQRVSSEGDPNSWYKNRRKRVRRIKGTEFSEEAMSGITSDAFQFLTGEVAHRNLQYIVHTLGYTPFNLIDVSYYTPDGLPAVLMLYPLNTYANNNYEGRFGKEARQYDYKKGETLFPFPTHFWLLSPAINTSVAELEKDGWINVLLERMRSNPDFLAQMESAHRAYAAERWLKLSEEHRKFVEEKEWVDILRDTGIAGMREFGGVKCLHTHYAHFLSRPAHGNIVGQWVHELLKEKEQSRQARSSETVDAH